MTIEQLDTSKVLISLCDEDMRDYKLQFNGMSFCSEHSKRVLLRLLQLACMRAGINYRSKTVLMEALPHQSGCLILVTMLESKKRKTYKVRRIKEQPCFVFESAEELLCSAEDIYRQEMKLYSNSLWLCEGKYQLVFDYPLLQDRVRRILGEYAEEHRITRVGVSRIKERGKLLWDHNALETIGEKICAQPKDKHIIGCNL